MIMLICLLTHLYKNQSVWNFKKLILVFEEFEKLKINIFFMIIFSINSFSCIYDWDYLFIIYIYHSNGKIYILENEKNY
jgi:hypothetical protein